MDFKPLETKYDSKIPMPTIVTEEDAFLMEIVKTLPPHQKELLYKKSRKKEPVDFRHAFIIVAINLGYNYSSIGRVMGKDRTTVMHFEDKERNIEVEVLVKSIAKYLLSIDQDIEEE